MSGTPRVRTGAFPSTPFTAAPSARRAPLSDRKQGPPSTPNGNPKIPDISILQNKKAPESAPLIPFETLDAPSQRFYVVSAYTALLLWRLYDFYNLSVDETESLWLFMKWASLDGIFIYGLPNLRIPWLEWSATTTTVLFCLHALLDGVLMFRIPIPLGAGLFAVSRALYDRELSISENRVKPADILNNPSLILGKQIINILPEGSAILNPDKIPVCIDTTRSSSPVYLPLQINQTVPSSIELIRFDIESSLNETIIIGSSQVKKLRRDAERKKSHHTAAEPLLLQYPVKKVGIYRLGRIIDETNLEVQHPRSEIHVVPCPKAFIKSSGSDKCRNEFSNVAIQVEGTPPLKITYHRAVDGKENPVTYQSIQPDDFVSPLASQKYFGPVVVHGTDDFTWARPRVVTVPLNETLAQSGKWSYSIDSVTDAFDNVVTYTIIDEETNSRQAKAAHLEDIFVVHDRPRVSLQVPSGEQIRRIAKGDKTELPIKVEIPGRRKNEDGTYTVQYLFTKHDDILSNGNQGSDITRHQFVIKSAKDRPSVYEPGLYSLVSVSSEFCEGEVIEPKTFQIINPPEPSVEIQSDEIIDKIGRSIGLRVSLDLSGTPPFTVQYAVARSGGPRRLFTQTLESPRGIIEMKPESDGDYTYSFIELNDAVYKGRPIRGLSLTQTVKPSVSAKFEEESPRARACIDQTASFRVKMQGESPWTLEWEIIHGGCRKRYSETNITASRFEITTPPLSDGGEYSVALVSVTDKAGCKESLQQAAKVNVRHQRPSAGFGPLEAKYSVRTLEGNTVSLPIQLSGEKPWLVVYRHRLGDNVRETQTKHFNKPNDVLKVSDVGTYEIVEVRDSLCPGVVDTSASRFDVNWVERPTVQIQENNTLKKKSDNVFERQGVCEGVEDLVEFQLQGQPPFVFSYDQKFIADSGSRSTRAQKGITVPLHNAQITMDTKDAGTYEYKVVELEDYNYNYIARRHTPFTITQKVWPRPSAVFTNPGKVYSFCQGAEGIEDGTTTIPVQFTGQPPFSIDLEIRPYGKSVRATPLTIPNIPAKSHSLHVPNRLLTSGTSTLTIRRIRDARGCERLLDNVAKPDPAQRVQIAVHERPAITPAEPERNHYCVGERISFALSGATPFNVFYTFQGSGRTARIDTPTFRRIAETPGEFVVTGVQDAGSACRASTSISRHIHPLPSVKVSRGKETRVDIHAGGQAEILFEFGGTPPFEFTYTRSENEKKGARKGVPGALLETKTLRSDEHELRIWASEEGTYEVVAVSDAFCSFARPGAEGYLKGRKMIMDV